MVNALPPIVIDNGLSTTRAGFALEELPSLVFNTNYVVGSDGTPAFGDEAIVENAGADVMTIMDDGVVYNTDNARHNWDHVFRNLDGSNGANASEHALMATENVWTANKTRAQMAQIAFEDFQVPLFSLVKTPLAQLYQMGRSSGLVIDVGSAVASVTPILDGIIQQKSSFHSKYAGDFLSLHCLRSLEAKLSAPGTQLDYTKLMPSQFQTSALSESFKQYHVTQHLLGHFKHTMLSTAEAPPGMPASNSYYPLAPHQRPALFQLPDGTHVSYTDQELTNLTEPLFVPHAYPLAGLTLPEPAFNKAGSHGVSNLALFSIKNLEAAFLASMGSESQGANASARFNEILRQLFSSTLITGGTALVPGFADRVCGDLSRTAPQLLPGYIVTGSYKLYISPLRNHNTGSLNDIFDKKFGAWLGAANLASMLRENTETESSSMGIALDNWFVSKADYEEMGEDLIAEKFK
ncbi:actin-domain-containing protein [Metschnikowia bicuspidata var. bicuspidata NRRL YB-4993]|uniref:Actin-domain-containing protein n=1 Tax=Metschnikowia bicuspidata var. bicuspidata NRRL YB-4993 TaxID=869754 RepID=A0A1A0HES8_9ASCO|nr:actin-domain-containing protein [Metschnikowia bicuspidata var. bicuspidata NRRL YB-4993]OBA22413.1 actin-domain-containing protein [Metschnikowia bicuspidata var. bicuspidata NRRL YB-4993]